jgi:hypothetical protein
MGRSGDVRQRSTGRLLVTSLFARPMPADALAGWLRATNDQRLAADIVAH